MKTHSVRSSSSAQQFRGKQTADHRACAHIRITLAGCGTADPHHAHVFCTRPHAHKLSPMHRNATHEAVSRRVANHLASHPLGQQQKGVGLWIRIRLHPIHIRPAPPRAGGHLGSLTPHLEALSCLWWKCGSKRRCCVQLVVCSLQFVVCRVLFAVCCLLYDAAAGAAAVTAVVGCWLFVVGFWWLVVGRWLVVVGCWLLRVLMRLLQTDRQTPRKTDRHRHIHRQRERQADQTPSMNVPVPLQETRHWKEHRARSREGRPTLQKKTSTATIKNSVEREKANLHPKKEGTNHTPRREAHYLSTTQTHKKESPNPAPRRKADPNPRVVEVAVCCVCLSLLCCRLFPSSHLFSWPRLVPCALKNDPCVNSKRSFKRPCVHGTRRHSTRSGFAFTHKII